MKAVNMSQINVNILKRSLDTWKQSNLSELTAKVRQEETEKNYLVDKGSREAFTIPDALIDNKSKKLTEEENKKLEKLKNYNVINEPFNSNHLLQLIKDKPE